MKALPKQFLILVLVPLSTNAFCETNYSFKGDQLASRICKSITDDNLNGLKKNLDQYRRKSTIYKTHFTKNTVELTKGFSCNSEDLYSFSETVGAMTITEYLDEMDMRKGRVFINDVATTMR